MHDDESIPEFFLRVDDIVNSMKNLGDEIKDTTIVESILRSLTPKFDSRVSAIEEMQDLKNITIKQLHGILTAYEMRKGDILGIREATFKATNKGKEKEDPKETSYILDKEKANFVKKLQVGISRFEGNIHFKWFSYGRVGHYGAKFPYKENHEKWKNFPKKNVKRRFFDKKNFYTHEDSEYSSDNEDDEKDMWC